MLQKDVTKYLLVLSILVLPFKNKMLELSIGPGGSETQQEVVIYNTYSSNFFRRSYPVRKQIIIATEILF